MENFMIGTIRRYPLPAFTFLAFLFTWVYNHTGGSIFMAILFHATINLTPAFIPTIPALGVADRIYYIQIGFNWLVVLLIFSSLLRSKNPKVIRP
jgi:membrane protease YdiL (CAAX protease family)